ILLECTLLAWLAKRWFSSSAAWGAVLFNLICATTFLRSRSLLSFSLTPLWTLSMMALLTQGASSRKMQWLAGLAAGLIFLDYEAWPFALCALSVVAYKENIFKDQFAWRWLAGIFLGLLLILLLSHNSLLDR